MKFEVKKGILGRYTVVYQCERCASPLSSSLDDAGRTDVCPDCNHQFVVPGVDHRDRIRAAEKLVAEQRLKDKELKETQREEQRLKREADARARREQEAEAAKSLAADREKREAIKQVHQNSRLIRCPYCAEEIQAAAKKCKHCGEFLTQDRSVLPNQNQPPKSGCEWIIIIALGIVAAIFLMALL